MAISLRAVGTPTTSGTRTNTTILAPAGATAGDYIVVAMDVGDAVSRVITPPAGWTTISTVQYSAADPWVVNLYVFGRFYDGAGSWQFTHPSGVSEGVAIGWQGVDVATPIDVAAQTATATTSTTITAPSLTIVTAGALSIIARGSWDGNAITPPGGWTERLDQPVLWVGDRLNASAGPTGTTPVGAGNAVVPSPAGIIHAALRPSSGTSATVADTAAGTDTATATRQNARLVADVAAGTDSANATQSLSQSVTDVAAGSDSASATRSTSQSLADSAAGSDAAAAAVSSERSLADQALGSDAVVTSVVHVVSVGDDADGSDDAVAVKSEETEAQVDDLASGADVVLWAMSRTRVLADVAAGSDTVTAALSGVVVRTVNDTASGVDAVFAALNPANFCWPDEVSLAVAAPWATLSVEAPRLTLEVIDGC